MKTKICTTIKQSKKLIELGIDVNTADMWYAERYEGRVTENGQYIIAEEPYYYPSLIKPSDINYSQDTIKDIPAWSLSALMKILPSEIYGENIYGDTITYKVYFRKYKLTDDVDLYQIAYGSIKFDVDGHGLFKDMINTGEKEDLIDAAFEMVCWLKENKKI